MKYAYFILKPLIKKKRSFFENNSLIIVTAESDFVYFLFARTNDIDSHSFCVNIMIERKQVPEIDFVIASEND